MLVLLAGLVILGLAGLFTWRPDFGLALLVFSLPFERVGTFSITRSGHPLVRPSQVVGAALTLALAMRAITKKVQLKRLPLFYWLALLLVSLTISTALAHYSQVWVNLVATAFLFALCYTVAQLTNRQSLRLAFIALIASAALVCLFGLFQYVGDLAGLSTHWTLLRGQYTKAVFGFPRVQSTALEPLYFANYLLLPLFVLLSHFVFNPKVRRGWLAATLVLVGLTFGLTLSRGAYLAAVLTLLLGAAPLGRKLGHESLRKLGIAAITGLLGFTLLLGASSQLVKGDPLSFPRTVFQLVSTKLNQTGTLTERLATQRQARQFFLAQPVFGLGPGGFGPRVLAYPAIRPETWPVANNALWEWLAEMGSVGFALTLGFLAHLFVQTIKNGRQMTDPTDRAWLWGLAGAVIAILIQLQSFSGFFITYIWVALGLLAGMLKTSEERQAKAHHSSKSAAR